MCLNIGFFNHRLTKPQPAVMVRWFYRRPNITVNSYIKIFLVRHKFDYLAPSEVASHSD